jgi:hypothetical protein
VNWHTKAADTIVDINILNAAIVKLDSGVITGRGHVRKKMSTQSPNPRIYHYYCATTKILATHQTADKKVYSQSKTKAKGIEMRCRFCGSNTVPPEIASDDTGTRSELQSGALPGELKRLAS